MKTLLITGSDLPSGFKGSAPSSSAGCLSPSKTHLSAKAKSREFEKVTNSEDMLVESAASLYSSKTAASADWSHLFRSKARINACLTGSWGKQLKMANVHLTPLTLTVGKLRFAAWDITMTISAGKQTLPAEIVVGGYLKGRALSALMIADLGSGKTSVVLGKAASYAVASKLARARV